MLDAYADPEQLWVKLGEHLVSLFYQGFDTPKARGRL
jgi:hypothetical protein